MIAPGGPRHPSPFAKAAGIFYVCLSGCTLGPSLPPVEHIYTLHRSQQAGIARYASGREQPAPLLLFIHGTPGSWQGYEAYLADPGLQSEFGLMAVDRPGFGASAAGLTTDLEQQAQTILDAVPADRALYVIGHSLGGPIALWSALLAPQRVCGVLLIAASLDPALEYPRWYNKLASLWLVDWLIPQVWSHANREVMALPTELSRLLSRLPAVAAPVSIVQGALDGLVLPSSPQAIIPLLPAESTRLREVPDAGHFLLWERRELVVEELLRLTREQPSSACRPAT